MKNFVQSESFLMKSLAGFGISTNFVNRWAGLTVNGVAWEFRP